MASSKMLELSHTIATSNLFQNCKFNFCRSAIYEIVYLAKSKAELSLDCPLRLDENLITYRYYLLPPDDHPFHRLKLFTLHPSNPAYELTPQGYLLKFSNASHRKNSV